MLVLLDRHGMNNFEHICIVAGVTLIIGLELFYLRRWMSTSAHLHYIKRGKALFHSLHVPALVVIVFSCSSHSVNNSVNL